MKYTSRGKNCTRKIASMTGTMTSILSAINKPKPTPAKDPNKPIDKPWIKNILWISPGLAPIVLRMAMSACFSFTVITKVDTKLNAATAIINVRIMNIIFFSVWTAANQLRFDLDQSVTQRAWGTIAANSLATSGARCISSTLTRKPDGSRSRNKAAASFQCMMAKELSYS